MNTIIYFFEKQIGLNCLNIILNDYSIAEVIMVSTGENSVSLNKANCAYKNKIRVENNPNNPALLKLIKTHNIRIGFSVSYSKIFGREIISAIPNGIFNLHPALLPKNRGCYPTMWSIINGDKYTGYTFHKIDSRVDTGDVVDQCRVRISSSDTGESLYAKQMFAGEKLFKNYFKKIINGEYKLKPQKGIGSHHGLSLPYDGYIPWQKDYRYVKRLIRAYYHSSYSKVKTVCKKKDYDVIDISRIPKAAININNIGEEKIIDGNIYFRCKDAVVKLITI